ncbi:hypothetical protein CEG14_14850 [Bordetella genomosp. 1]|uniref:DUF3168 domain-containing protein n=1 Tax=Bordetella genomosp. 1 TaxID=1395607 RepID=A0A261SFT1_9BORD|nr:DUF3168 domain-containing protein [Bordetella genomosp. 1]OZI36288.1 hypothetical protein CEG14_14850 [Bordetella genomosp. 1]
MVEAKIIAALGPLVNDRVYPDTATADTPLPFITFQRAGGAPLVYVDGTLPDKANARMQINVWGKGRAEVSRVMAAVEEALCSAPAFGLPLGGPIDRSDELTGFKGAQQDFSIWYERS